MDVDETSQAILQAANIALQCNDYRFEMLHSLVRERMICDFCGKGICGCTICQAYCGCEGYAKHYIIPYMEEQARLGPN